MKAKRGAAYGDPLEMITAEKRRRLALAAELWLARHPECAGLEIAFEAVAISPDGLRRVSVA